MSTLKKEETIKKLSEKIKKAKAIYLTDYLGLSVADLQELREKIKEKRADYQVVKNTLFKRALDEVDLEKPAEWEISGSTAVIFSYEDEVAPLREVTQFAKEKKLPELKSGFLGDKFLSSEKLQALSKLQSKEILRVKLFGTLNAPASHLVSLLNGPLYKLILVLNNIKISKGG